jgi:hypothetical protein
MKILQGMSNGNQYWQAEGNGTMQNSEWKPSLNYISIYFKKFMVKTLLEV